MNKQDDKQQNVSPEKLDAQSQQADAELARLRELSGRIRTRLVAGTYDAAM